MDHNKLENAKRWEYQTTLTASWETYLQVKKQQLELDMETGSKLGKEYVKAVYCHSACLTYMQSTSCRMLGWMNHKLASRLPGEISTAPEVQMKTNLMAKSKEELNSLSMRVKEVSEKAGLKLNIQKTKIIASSPITSWWKSKKVGLKLNIQKTKIMASCTIISWQIDGETAETVADFIFLGSKITADGDCSHEIKRH